MVDDSLIAWITSDEGEVLAAYMAAGAEAPAMRRCSSEGEAREWVENEARGAPIDWESS